MSDFTFSYQAHLTRFIYPLLLVLGGSIVATAQQTAAQPPGTIEVTGQITDLQGNEALIGVSVLVRGEASGGTATDMDGRYAIRAGTNDTLVFSYIGYTPQVVPVNNRSVIDLALAEDVQSLEEIVVTGYGTQKRESITGAIATIGSDEIGRVKNSGTSASTGLAGKIPGVSFRQADGRPNSSANVQIRNMGEPLYVIDGIQQDGFQFNRLAPADIESISILKDGAAAIYGFRAANGVVLVTTKRGNRGERASVNFDANYGVQNWVNFPTVTNSSYIWALEKIQADVNGFGTTNITPEDLERYRVGTERGFQSFDWANFILKKNSPISQINLNTSGGSERINYYAAINRNYSNSVLGDEFDYGRTNIISNVDVNITDRLKVGVGINGYSETTENPGIPGYDDYWLPRYAILRNKPWQRPYANDNPEYINDIGHNETNWAYNNFENGGYLRDNRKFGQVNGTLNYKVPFLSGLSVQGLASYHAEERQLDVHEYTYDTYTYFPATEESEEEYRRTGGSTNPYRERQVNHVQVLNTQIGLNYAKIFGRHEVGALFLSERYEQKFKNTFTRAQPQTNVLPLIYFNDIDQFSDGQSEVARLGYVARLNYNFANRYYVEVSGRRDGSWRFAPDRRIGYFPGGSIGWRITEEPFLQNLLGESKVLTNLKLRASYAVVGDDNVIDPFLYLEGYSYNRGIAVLNGNPIVGTQDNGQPITNITWFTSEILNIGADYSLFGGRITGQIDVFNRKRDGLRGRKYDVLLPSELGYGLPDENVSSDRVFGAEGLIAYNGSINTLTFSVSTNLSFARSQFLSSYNPVFFNSWDEYRYSGEGRYNGITWGYQVIGQFESQEQINNYEVNVDGQGNNTLLPGDLIYKDVNGDGKIDGYDERPIGYGSSLPLLNGGLSITANWKGFDLALDFSLASGYSFTANDELRRAFRANGGNIATHLRDAWHREDPYDVNSEWIPGYFPPNRFDQGGLSSVNKRSDFWLVNVTAFRARTFQLGYSLPSSLTSRVNIQRARVYLNGFNLFSLHNVKRYNIDPEVSTSNGLDYPQSRVVSAGVNLTF
ncbi:SusC/RagA family TonB-linked outer membrane protein [Lewinella sp. IMCC34183]|uniref:SusC/RagA family TonB-linked outer membrane protein n=1 Tax=Lewinella sp. IMCC34183 TaxID=2248762 RepID=UPI000E26173F|nr:TonB-dependent receptor [Lewinella sp. IMCC34183]